jgi:tRNA(Arg) A34 adenosine deaminase TadA
VERTSPLPELRITYPSWVTGFVAWDRVYGDPEERMHLAVQLARENVLRSGGGPFGAAVFERDSGQLVSVGMNLVITRQNSVLHAEIVALMMAQRVMGSYSLDRADQETHELVTSCDPCAMCLGAVGWSGIRRLTCGAMREDAKAIGFDEGPVFPESWRYLERRGIEIVRGVLREEARGVLALYKERGGLIYNG